MKTKLAGAMVAMVLLAACVTATPGATSPDPVITPAEAARIATQVIRTEFSAIQGLRPEELDAVASGVALRVDRARILDLRARHELGPTARPIQVTRVAVPRQQRYPARFLALSRIAGEHGPTYNLANFTRPNARDPWTIDLTVDLPQGSTPPQFAITAGGWAGALPSRSMLEQAIDDVPLGYVEFRQGAWRRVEPTARNDFRNPGPFTSDLNGRDQDQAASDRRNHILDDDTFAFGAADGAPAYAVAGGGVLVLAGLEEDFSQKVDPSAGGCIDLTNDGGTLAPPSGRYGAIRLRAVIQAAFLDPTRAGDGGVEVVALDRGFLQFDPAHATPCG